MGWGELKEKREGGKLVEGQQDIVADCLRLEWPNNRVSFSSVGYV